MEKACLRCGNRYDGEPRYRICRSCTEDDRRRAEWRTLLPHAIDGGSSMSPVAGRHYMVIIHDRCFLYLEDFELTKAAQYDLGFSSDDGDALVLDYDTLEAILPSLKADRREFTCVCVDPPRLSREPKQYPFLVTMWEEGGKPAFTTCILDAMDESHAVSTMTHRLIAALDKRKAISAKRTS